MVVNTGLEHTLSYCVILIRLQIIYPFYPQILNLGTPVVMWVYILLIQPGHELFLEGGIDNIPLECLDFFCG